MGYLITALLLFAIAAGIITLYEIIPDHLRENIGHLIDELGGESK